MDKNKKTFFGRIINWMWRHKWLMAGIVLGIILIGLIFAGTSKSGKSGFATATISRGDLRQIVSATGEIQPLNMVSVGSQVSGIIEEIYVDYNSRVKKGDVLLKIDTSVLQASVDEAKASLDSAISQRNYAKNEYLRNKTLYQDDYIARAEMEQSQTQYEQAQAAVVRAQSQYDKAVTNLGYATIVSPVDGTVISRKVDVGQTVAASFQTPDLFEIAEDLSKMQIETSVSEADIGVIKEGQKVTFTVDAYTNQTFEGNVRQIRLSPTTTSNVVVYTVVIDVDNSDMRLMPGMTAFVTVIVEERTNVLKVQNSALLLRTFDEIVENAGDATPATHMAVMRGDKIVLVPYTRGLATATETQIISDELSDGDKIVIGKLGQSSKSTNNNRRNMGMGGRPM